jgi:hypothetical protein
MITVTTTMTTRVHSNPSSYQPDNSEYCDSEHSVHIVQQEEEIVVSPLSQSLLIGPMAVRKMRMRRRMTWSTSTR